MLSESEVNSLITLYTLGSDPKSLSHVQYLIVMSALQRGDRVKALKLLHDWQKIPGRPVLKWVPGDHFYALDAKFNTYQEAEEHLLQQGFACSGLRYRYIYLESE